MKILSETYKNSGHLHHAYIIEGQTEIIHPQICNFCENDLSIKIQGNPDFIFEEKDKFIISDARRLRDLQLNKTKEGERQVFIISFNFITREAQNALLKVLEEPTDGTHIFIITPTTHVFLPTVLSRVTLITSSESGIENNLKDDAKEFLKSSHSERLKKIAKLVKDIKDEKASKSNAIQLVRSLEFLLHEESLKDKTKSKEDIKKLKELEKVANYMHDQGASTKMLLEHIALIV